MRAQDLEPEMEELLFRLVPNIASQWQGATEDEIDQIERIAARPLPRFYRWFLMRMGHSMGPIAYPTLDFSAPTVLRCYAERLFVPHPRFLMIGHESDEMMPLHMLYDFDYPARDDALVTKRHSLGGAAYHQFETLREMIAWGEVLTHRVERSPQRCLGIFGKSGSDIVSHLDPLMVNWGFRTSIQTGPCCAVYEGPHGAMVSRSAPDAEPGRHVFRLGGSDAGRLRRILGEIATESSLELKIREWDPPLAP